MNPLKVIIIGAGTGGLCLAHGLRRAGIEVVVYERDRTRRDGLQGYRVGISPDGSRALHDALPPELFDTFVATCARTPLFFTMLTEKKQELLTLDVGPGDADALNSERSVSRMTLRQVLLTGLDDIVRFDKAFTHYEQHEDGTVTAHFADGSSDTGSLLVGADGTNSRVRRQYLPHAKIKDAGLVAIAGKVPFTPQTEKLLTPTIVRGVTMVNAPGGFSSIIHVMVFPWDDGGAPKSGIGSTDAELIEHWPGLAFDNSRDYISWGFSGAAQNLPADLTELSSEQLHDLVQERTRDWHEDFRTLFAVTDKRSLFPITIRTSEPIPKWTPSTVTLIGDAVHTMTPGRGVGANTALRDARLLKDNLVAVHQGRMPLLTAVDDYETQMIEYSSEAVRASLKQMSGSDPIHRPVIGRVVLAGMRLAMRIINAVPSIKRKLERSQQEFRGKDRDQSSGVCDSANARSSSSRQDMRPSRRSPMNPASQSSSARSIARR
ncbi:FAD-dependent monooxygenase [Pseudonocardiaceae bacterium YIM PH 21723]|nr:FAD-dependent monooxygenase [Pseudonocardiaceae bacterium YIM PH 21723]